MIVPIEEARMAWLELMIPQLQEGGFHRLAAEYAIELERLAAREKK